MIEIPSVRSVMTPAPRVVDALEDTRTAKALMTQYGIRHLPVLKEGKLYGVLSERDLRAARAFLDEAPGEPGPPVMVMCSHPAVVVRPTDPVDAVAMQLANERVGSAVVVDRDVVVGIVTTVDLCRNLAQLVQELRAEHSHPR
jgi:acetoin utilization protein AcuB